MRFLVTGGAGFLGSNLCIALKEANPETEVAALDNLYRSGSELNVPRLEKGGVTFIHGDVRDSASLAAVGPVDWLIECSAESSVHAGYGGDPRYLLDTNLLGAVNCLEHLRVHGGGMVFFSTSRVYPIAALRNLPLVADGNRLVIESGASGQGWSAAGITEDFPIDGVRSLYGATKLSAEMLVTEYAAMYGIASVINRCGVIAGPWQMGKVDQGFVALWAARHLFGGPLKYMGFGGEGRQVRDIVHPADVYDLLQRQIQNPEQYTGRVFNVGGGAGGSLSLRELTALCGRITGETIEIGSDPETREADIPYFVCDNTRIIETAGWRPRHGVAEIVEEVCRWLTDNRSVLEPIFAV